MSYLIYAYTETSGRYNSEHQRHAIDNAVARYYDPQPTREPFRTEQYSLANLPQLETARCILEPFTKRHLTDHYVSWLNDPDVVRYSEQRHKRHDLASCKAYMESFAGSPHYFIAITEKDQNLGHIGNMNVYVDENNSAADVGILLGHKQIWGHGYGVEVWNAVCRYLPLDLNLRKVTAGTSANNMGMRGIMHRSGMTDDGIRRRQLVMEGQEIDIIYGALFRDSLLGH